MVNIYVEDGDIVVTRPTPLSSPRVIGAWPTTSLATPNSEVFITNKVAASAVVVVSVESGKIIIRHFYFLNI